MISVLIVDIHRELAFELALAYGIFLQNLTYANTAIHTRVTIISLRFLL